MGGDGARVEVRTQAPCQTEGWGEAAGEKWPVKDRKPEPRFQGVRARVAKLHCAQTIHTGPVRSHGLVHCAPGRSGRRIKRGTCSRVDGNRSRGNGGVTRTQQRTRKPSNAQPGLKGRPAGGGGGAELGTTGVTGRQRRAHSPLAAWPSAMATATSFPGGGEPAGRPRGQTQLGEFSHHLKLPSHPMLPLPRQPPPSLGRFLFLL